MEIIMNNDWKKNDLPLETIQTRVLIAFGIITLLFAVFTGAN